MQVANQADISGAGGRWNGLRRSRHPEASRAWSLSHFGLRLNRKRAGLAGNGRS